MVLILPFYRPISNVRYASFTDIRPGPALFPALVRAVGPDPNLTDLLSRSAGGFFLMFSSFPEKRPRQKPVETRSQTGQGLGLAFCELPGSLK